MPKITKNGIIRNQTELSMYHALHRDADVWRTEWNVMPRRTKHARAALVRWETEGILEVSTQKHSPHSTYTYKAYRLAEQYRDPSIIDNDLMGRAAAATETEALAIEAIEKSEAGLREAWAQMMSTISGMETLSDDDLDAVYTALSAAQSAVNSRRVSLRNRAAATKMREEIDEQLAQRAISGVPVRFAAPGEDSDGDEDARALAYSGDPLGGDA